MRVLVTGGAGFIGSHFVYRLIQESDISEIIILDKITYAGDLSNLTKAMNSPKVSFYRNDICAAKDVEDIFSDIDAVVNFAAESHVDRSISDSEDFIVTNILGTRSLLEICRKRGIRFLQVSTDEVYGSIETGHWDESFPLEPNSPYSASKAAVIGMTKVQGKEYAENGITVNALAPAVIRTAMVEALPEQQVKYMTDKIPMKRCGTLEEAADTATFIVSPEASFSTAFTFDLSGGRATY